MSGIPSHLTHWAMMGGAFFFYMLLSLASVYPQNPRSGDDSKTAATGTRVIAAQDSAATRSLVQQARGKDLTGIAPYCGKLVGSIPNSSALEKVCEFALSTRKKLPNVICDQETKRYWPLTFGRGTGSDVIMAKVSYREGKEYRENVRVNGKPVDDTEFQNMPGSWSFGEFATILSGIFDPSSKPQLVYVTETKVGGSSALVFRFHVSAETNKTYFLDGNDGRWFPEYSGKLWIEKKTFQLLRMERETDYGRQRLIRRAKTKIEYSNIHLKDGTSLVLPTHSVVQTCSASKYGAFDNCSRNVIKFSNWQKFRATTRIVSELPE